MFNVFSLHTVCLFLDKVKGLCDCSKCGCDGGVIIAVVCVWCRWLWSVVWTGAVSVTCGVCGAGGF